MRKIIGLGILLALAAVALRAEGRALFNLQTHFVISVQGASMEDGAQLITWPYEGRDNQFWEMEPVEDGWFMLRNAHSGKYMGVLGGSDQNGAAIVQWREDRRLNQQWRWSDGMLVNRGSHKVIGVANRETEPGGQLIQWFDDGTPNQRWEHRPFQK